MHNKAPGQDQINVSEFNILQNYEDEEDHENDTNFKSQTSKSIGPAG